MVLFSQRSGTESSHLSGKERRKVSGEDCKGQTIHLIYDVVGHCIILTVYNVEELILLREYLSRYFCFTVGTNHKCEKISICSCYIIIDNLFEREVINDFLFDLSLTSRATQKSYFQ